MTAQERNAKITSIINSMKLGETKRFQSGAEVTCDSYTPHGYAVVSPDGDTAVDFISKQKAIELVISSYN